MRVCTARISCCGRLGFGTKAAIRGDEIRKLPRPELRPCERRRALDGAVNGTINVSSSMRE